MKSSQELLDEQHLLDEEIKRIVIGGGQAQPRISLSDDQLEPRDRMAVVQLAKKTGNTYQATLQRLFRAVIAQAEAELKKGK